MHQVKRVKVDKAMAELFLSLELQPEVGKKGTNRKFSPIVVNNYAVEMLAERWRETHQGLAFKGYLKDDTAVYVDGGQRARALIQAATVGAQGPDKFYKPDPNIALYFMVTEGLTDEDVRALDIGKHRTPGDFVQMEGWARKNMVASVARLCILYETVPWSPENWRKARVTPTMIQDYLASNPRIADAISEGSRLFKYMMVSSASAGWYLAVTSGVEEKLVNEFVDHMYDGAELPKGSAILALRDMLARTGAKRRKWTREEQLALFIKALLKWIDGAEVQFLSFKTGGEHPDKFPRFTN
jgi:hypothetical protein